MNLAVSLDRDEYNMAAPASCISAEHGCVMFDCLVHLWEWIDPPVTQTHFQMENKKNVTATQQPLTQQHLMAHHVHPDQIYSPQNSQIPAHLNNQAQIQPNGVMHQLLQSQYHSNMNARSPLLENRHEMYGTGHNHDYARHYGANDNFNYPQSPPRFERTEIHTDQNVNHELLQNMPKGYNAEVYQDYLKRNPPKESNQIYQNHQPIYRPNVNQYATKPYLPYSSRIGPQSNTELLRKQYNEIQQMKMQQQMHYQNQAQMHQQQKFAERQLLLQQLHGVQPPPNLQNSIYSDSSYRDLYSSKSDFKDYSSPDLQKDFDMYAKNDEYRDRDIQNRQYQDNQWAVSPDYREDRQKSQHEQEKAKSPEFNNKKSGLGSPMKSSESSTPSIKSPSSESRRSSGTTALRSPTAQRIPTAPITICGLLYKQGSDGLKVWRKRWFVLSEYCLFYYKSQDEEKLLGSVLLPSYKVSACSTEDKVMRKFAFKLEHANMRTYVLAALDQEAMLKWVKALTMAALMQSPNEQQKQNERTPAKTEDEEDAGPTYANAPPKPRRSNDGYNSPSPDMYDPNYDLLKKPASHYSQGTRHQDTYSQENYTRSPQSQQIYQTKRYDTQNLSLPLNTDTIENSPNTPSQYKSNQQSPYFNNRSRNQEPDDKIESVYDKQPGYNPFQDYTEKPNDKPTTEANKIYNESYPETRTNSKTFDLNKPKMTINERIVERRTPDAYGRSTTMSAYNTEKIGDYEDIYAAYNDKYVKSPSTSLSKDTVSLSSHKSPQDQTPTHPQEKEKTFSGPSVLRRKKMQASGIQPPMPRPHSADFLEYESKNEINKNKPTHTYETKQPKRPKSSLDINSYYDPSSDKYYSEESYAQKMRQSAQYLQQQAMGSRNIQIPLEKYASGLAEKQLHSPYSQTINNNYETEFSVNRNARDNVSYNSKYSDIEGMNSNWTLKEKEDNQKDYMNRSGSVMSDSSNVSAFVKEKYDPSDSFMRSASARLPSTEKDGEKKVQQREESMKRLIEWKQRMLQSPLTRKSTPATISLARSLNQSRQSLRSDQYKPKTYKNASYNSYSSDDEASMTMSGTNIEPGPSNNNNNNQIQQALSKKAFLGSNTSIGRTNRDGNIPVRAVSPRVRWVEEKPSSDQYGSQQITTSQQNLNIIGAEETWTTIRSPSRSQQPIRAVSPRVRRNTENDDLQKDVQSNEIGEIPTAGELLGRSHEELVLLLIQLRRRHAITHRSIESCCAQINSIEDCLSILKAKEREESLQRLEQLKMHLMELESQYEKSKPLVQLVDNMVKLGSLYNRPGSTIERLERNQRLRQKVLTEHAIEKQRWIESAAAGKPLETEAARVRVAELWALEQELADEAAILQGLKTDKDAIDSLLTGVRSKPPAGGARAPAGLEAELARVHAMLAHNSKKLEQTVADNARLERELQQLRAALRAQPRAAAVLEDEVSRVQQLVSALQQQRQELSRAVRHLTRQSHALQTTHDSVPVTPAARRDSELHARLHAPLYVDTRDAPHHDDLGNLSNVEKQEIKTVRIVKRESERRQRDRDRSLQPMSDWSTNITANLDQFLEEELVQPINNYRASSLPRTDYKYEDYYKQNDCRQEKNLESPKYPSSPSLSNYDYSRDMSSLSSSYNRNYKHERSLSNQYTTSPTDSSRTLTNMSKTSSIISLTRSNMELSPIFKSEAAKQIVTEMNDNGSMHRRQVPREKRRHYTAPHHLSAKTLNEMPKDGFNQDTAAAGGGAARARDDADLARALRADVLRSARDSIDLLLAAPQKILIPERYIPEKPPELSPEEQQKRQEKVESIKKMLTSSSADPSKSPDGEEKKQREHLLQMNQILAQQVTEMSKIIAGTNTDGPSSGNN